MANDKKNNLSFYFSYIGLGEGKKRERGKERDSFQLQKKKEEKSFAFSPFNTTINQPLHKILHTLHLDLLAELIFPLSSSFLNAAKYKPKLVGFVLQNDGSLVQNSASMDSETASSVDEQLAGAAAQPGGGGSDTRGKHRILAELKRVEQEIKFFEVSFGDSLYDSFLFIICLWYNVAAFLCSY